MAYSDIILAESNLVGYWRLNETSGVNAADSSGSGNLGNYSNIPTLGQPGPFPTAGTSVLFNGSTNAMFVANSASLALTGDLSLEAWIKTTFAGVQACIIAKYAPSTFFGWAISVRSGKLAMWVGDGTGGWFNGTRSINDGQWHHVVGVLSGTTVLLYTDGTLDTSATRAPSRTNTNQLVVARAPDAAIDFLPATLDELAVYSKALSATAVANHYAGRLLALDRGAAMMVVH